MRASQRGPFSYIVTALLAIGGAVLAAQQDQNDSFIITQRLNGVEVDMLQGPGGGFVQMRSPQVPSVDGSDPMMGPIVRGAPYSGDGITTVVQTLGDGTRIEQEARARFYRDGAGRIRREQTIIGLAPLNPAANAQVVVTIVPNPDDGWAYQLDAEARTARRVMRGGAFTAVTLTATMRTGDTVGRFDASGTPNTAPAAGGRRGGPPPQTVNRPGAEQLGSRSFEGVRATGTKTTTTIPAGQIGNDRPIEITDERWESPELKVLVYSRHSDPRTGVVEYRITGLNRADPAQDLFQIPSDYEVLSGGGRTGGPGPAGAGGRGGPATVPIPPGARGGRQ